MSSQQDTSPSVEALEQTVCDHLRDNSDFFSRHPELLRKMELPHQSGNAVSLIERQVSNLREQANQYKQQLEDLITVARENEGLNNRLHKLTLTLLDCLDFEEVVNALQDRLHEDFRAEAVELHLFFSDEADRESNPDLDGFRDLLDNGRPECGPLPMEQLTYLFGPQAEDIKSTALIPIEEKGILGVLAIGSQSEHRFHPGMGTDYLARLGEIVSKTLEVVSEPGF
ncbi:MAG: DUF484 family protein [Candidatus Sedimenticola sp. (ex Thyasira tokunagai)]